MTPQAAYRSLMRRYGPRGWWPVTPRGGTKPVYRPGRRAAPSEAEAFEIAVGAILTQNTAWTNVERALESLHGDGPLTPERLLGMAPSKLERLIRSSGYFRQKAERLLILAAEVRRRGGSLRRWIAKARERAREELLALKGVGPETADSILLYAGAAPSFVIDAYTLRIGRRVGWFGKEARYEDAQASLGRALARGARSRRDLVLRFQEFHALLVELAKRHCRPEPDCRGCPLDRGCAHAA